MIRMEIGCGSDRTVPADNNRMQRTVGHKVSRQKRRRAAAEPERYALKFSVLLPQLFLVALMFVPQLARAQTCEWDRFPEPAAGMDVIEVHRH